MAGQVLDGQRLDAVVRSGGGERGAVASGQDIYAVTAPLAVEAVARVVTGRTRTVGVASAGVIFDAPGFLRALSAHISVTVRPSRAGVSRPLATAR